MSRAQSRNAKASIKHWLDGLDAPTQDREIDRMREVFRLQAKQNHHFFAQHVMGHADVDSELHRDMSYAWTTRGKQLFSLFLVPRGHLKTSLLTEDGTVWELINNPHERHLIINAKLQNAIDIIANIRSQFENNEVLRWLFPEYCVDLASKEARNQCKWGVDRLDFPCSRYRGRREGNIQIMAVEASAVSKHYDTFTFDDGVNDENSTTRAYRTKIENWYLNALQLRHDPGISIVRLIGTRWHLDDLYGRIIKKEKAHRQRLKDEGKKVVPRYWIYRRSVVEPVPDGVEGYDIVGQKNVRPIWPERFTPKVIEDTRSELASYIFSCQYLNNPISGEQAVFKHEDIKEIEDILIPDGIRNFLAMDLAVSDKDESDWSAITVASFDSVGKMYIREIFRKKMLPREALEHVWRLVNKWNVERVAIENVAFQNTVYRYYQEICSEEGWNIPWHPMKRGNTHKAARFMALQPRVERGDFFVERGIEGTEELLDEMTGFSLDHLPPYDDILDTLADLEQIYFKASDDVPDELPVDSFDAIHGAIIDEKPRRRNWRSRSRANPMML